MCIGVGLDDVAGLSRDNECAIVVGIRVLCLDRKVEHGPGQGWNRVGSEIDCGSG